MKATFATDCCLDGAVQNNMAAKAVVATAEAQIKIDQAAVETAKTSQDFTRLTSPIEMRSEGLRREQCGVRLRDCHNHGELRTIESNGEKLE